MSPSMIAPPLPAELGVVRAMIFEDRPDCIVFYVPEGTYLIVPALLSPFDRQSVGETFAGRRIRVTESRPGRWTTSFEMMRKADRAERHQMQRQRDAQRAVLMRSGTAIAQTRVEAIEQKHLVDAQIRDIKVQIGTAKGRAATHGEYMPPHLFRNLETTLKTLQEKSLAIQAQLGDLRRREKAEEHAAHQDENERFRNAAHRVLDEETLCQVLEAMGDDDEAPQ